VLGREAVADILKLNDVVDLVIPRGSNALVTYIQVRLGTIARTECRRVG
jgi:gamma-glutamyl phosphate reductase